MKDDAEAALAEVLAEVRRIDVQTRRLVTDVMAGGYVSVFRGAGVEFDEVREYAEGDDPRTVDWNVTARVGRPFVKKYVAERERTILFLLDLSASMHAGLGAWSPRQTAARVVACLALAATRSGDKVGLVAFGGGVERSIERFVEPRRGLGRALRIVRDVLALPAAAGEARAAAGLSFAARAVHRRSVAFLVSDFLVAPDRAPLSACARRHDLIAVRLTSPESLALPRALVRARDPETGAEVLVDGKDADVGARYAERAAVHRATVEDELRRARVDLLEVPIPRTPSPDAIARPILTFFRMREQRGAKV
jgi:uncharacterized protein (DUF58 family)